MKRNLENIILVLILGTFLVSCEKDLLDTVPSDRLSEDVFWKTQSDAELATNSLYNDLDGTNIFSFDALTDIAHTNQPFEVQAYIESGNYDAQNSKIYNEWSNAYKGIGATNYFLANVDKIPIITDSAKFRRYQGEARVLRAYQYIKLASLYGSVPLVTTPLTLAEGRTVRRASLDSIWDFVDKELQEAAVVLPSSYTGQDLGRITKWAAWGLKARADLYAGRYQLAADAANTVIQSGACTLYPNYGQLFSYAAENNSEVILDKQFIASTNSNNVFYLLAPYSQKNSQSTYVPTKALVDQYQTADGKDIGASGSGYDPNSPYSNRDPRLRCSIFIDGDVLPSGAVFHPAPNSGTSDAVGSTYVASTTGFNIKKNVNASDYANPSNNGINIILLRYAEVLLTYAEAKIELNQLDASVYSAINQIRNGRADVHLPSLSTGLSQSELRAAVRRERTVELAFEGLHLTDIRRWKTAETVVPGNVYGITYVDNGTVKIVEAASGGRVFNASRDYLWPIPQKERDLNPNLTQNLNW